MKLRLDMFRIIFLAIFILANLAIYWLYINGGHQITINTGLGDHPEKSLLIDWKSVTTISSSIVTSLVALLGFIVTTMFSLRKEKREARESELALKQKEIELERMRLEIEQLKKKPSVKAKNKVTRNKNKSK